MTKIIQIAAGAMIAVLAGCTPALAEIAPGSILPEGMTWLGWIAGVVFILQAIGLAFWYFARWLYPVWLPSSSAPLPFPQWALTLFGAAVAAGFIALAAFLAEQNPADASGTMFLGSLVAWFSIRPATELMVRLADRWGAWGAAHSASPKLPRRVRATVEVLPPLA